jgi:hypothetical protein
LLSTKKFDEAKKLGTFPDELCSNFLDKLGSGEKHNRKEVKPPAGFDVFRPRVWVEASEDAKVAAVLLEVVLPGVTPAQAFTMEHR